MGLGVAMRVLMRDLGPVRGGGVKLGDVTLFMGPPNTGKSYALRAIYAKLSPLDEYAAGRVERRLSARIAEYLEREFRAEASASVRRLVSGVVELVAALRSGKGTQAVFGRMGEAGLQVAEAGGSVVVRGPPMEWAVDVGVLRQMAADAFYGFMAELVPVKGVDTVRLEPLEPLDVVGALRRSVVEERRYLLGWFGQAGEVLRRLGCGGDELERLLFSSSVSLHFDVWVGGRSSVWLEFRIDTRAFSPGGAGRVEKTDGGLSKALDKYVEELVSEVVRRSAAYLSSAVVEGVRDALRSRLGFEGLRFVPFGRSVLVLALESASREPYARPVYLRRFVGGFYPSVLASYVYWASEGRRRLLEGLDETGARVLDAAAPLLEGRLVPGAAGNVLYKDWRGSLVEFRLSSALVGEVSGLLFPLLSAGGRSLVLVEEPEAQLHPGAQIAMALFLASLPALCGCRVVATTHSDLLAITMSQLAVQRPDREWVVELLARVLPHVKEGVDVLAGAVAEAAVDLRIYEFTREGKVAPVRPEDVLGKEVPGISRVIDELTDWAFRLASRRE